MLSSANITQKCAKTTSRPCSVCKIFSGNRTEDLFSYLDQMNFKDALRQSLCLGIIQPSGVSSIINYDKPIDENTRFLYYLYTDRTEEFEVTPQNRASIMTYSQESISRTHVITKIQWGIEIICVIQISSDDSPQMVDNLLQTISERLKNNQYNFSLTDHEKTQIDRLKNVTAYGSPKFIKDSHMPLNSILRELLSSKVKKSTYQHPLVYTMHSLNWIDGKHDSTKVLYSDDGKNSHITKIEFIIRQLNAPKTEVMSLLNTRSKEIPQGMLSKQCDEFRINLSELSKVYEKFRTDCGKKVQKLRQNVNQVKEADISMLDTHYTQLKHDFNILCKHVHEWENKIVFIQQLENDKITYQELSQIIQHPLKSNTFKDIDHQVKSKYQKFPCVVLCYSNDTLRQENVKEWDKKYQEFKSDEGKKSKAAMRIYIDFIGYENLLSNFTLIELPDQLMPTTTTQTSLRMYQCYIR